MEKHLRRRAERKQDEADEAVEKQNDLHEKLKRRDRRIEFLTVGPRTFAKSICCALLFQFEAVDLRY